MLRRRQLMVLPMTAALPASASDLADALAQAAIAVVGRVDYVERGSDASLVRLAVQTALKPAGAGSVAYDVVARGGPLFAVGEVWLVLGRRAHVGIETDAAAGSVRLSTADGTPDCAAWRAAAALAPGVVTLPESCR